MKFYEGVVWAGLVVPGWLLYTVDGTNHIIGLILAVAGMFFFQQNFEDKSVLRKRAHLPVGSPEAFNPSNSDFNYKLNNQNIPVRSQSPPPLPPAHDEGYPPPPPNPPGRYQ